MDSENMSPQEQAAERFAREQRLEALGLEVDALTDKLGEPVDSGIRETLIGLRAHKIETTQSCEGHDDRAEALPWVDIQAPAPEGWEEDERKKQLWRRWNEREVEAVRQLLAGWYQRRMEEAGKDVPAEERLTLDPRGIYGAMRLEPAVQEVVSALKGPERARRAAPYRQEMQRFAAYLKERFLTSK